MAGFLTVAGEADRAPRFAREFTFTRADFERVRALIRDLAGICLSEFKQDLVYGRLARRLRITGHTRFSSYLDMVAQGERGEREAFTNALTTNLTSFFREAHHFPILAEHAARHAGVEPYRVWCSACSTGEEAYSIAITLDEAFEGREGAFQLLASDVDTQVLDAARRGVFPLERLKGMESGRLRRYFQRGVGRREGFARVRPALAGSVRFARINLLDPAWPIGAPLDVIFCRNVMIYFDKSTQRRLLGQFLPLLKPGGLLICGHSESLLHSADLFRNLGRTVYAPVAGRS